MNKTDPAKIGEGMYCGMSFAEYVAIDAYNASLIKKADVPAKAKHYMDFGSGIDADKKAPIRGGLVLHAKIFEPDSFDKTFAVSETKIARNSNDWKDFVKATPGRLHIWPEEIEAAQDSIEAVRRDQSGFEFSGCRSEVTGVWFDKRRGVWFKMRIDAHWLEALVIVDLKRTQDASPDSWRHRVTGLQHHVQAALYLEGVLQITGEPHDWLWLIVEDKPPYLSVIRKIEPMAIQVGTELIDERIEMLKTCEETGLWPGYPEDEFSGLTDWGYRQHNERMEN